MKKLYDPSQGVMRVAGLMSGSGSNIRKLIEHQKVLDDTIYKIVVLFSDKSDSKAKEIGREYGIPVITQDIREFYRARGKKRSDLSIRPEFDSATVEALKKHDVPVAAYGGYMSIASKVLTNAFLGVNVHPADLSIERDGQRVYRGDNAVADAIKAGESHICSSTHMITEEVDAGPIFMISKPLRIDRELSASENQDRLKEYGDWVILPKTLEYLARGLYSRDESGMLYFRDRPIPKGLKRE